jgi:hypothetical protein
MDLVNMVMSVLFRLRDNGKNQDNIAAISNTQYEIFLGFLFGPIGLRTVLSILGRFLSQCIYPVS